MLKVEGHENLYRDPDSGAILNYDDASYNKYVATIRARSSSKQEISELKEQVEQLKKMVYQLMGDQNG
jgi:hypothetical protein